MMDEVCVSVDADERVMLVSVSVPVDVIEMIGELCAVVMEIVNVFIVIDPVVELRNAGEKAVPIFNVTVPDEESVSDDVSMDIAVVSFVCVPSNKTTFIDV